MSKVNLITIIIFKAYKIGPKISIFNILNLYGHRWITGELISTSSNHIFWWPQWLIQWDLLWDLVAWRYAINAKIS